MIWNNRVLNISIFVPDYNMHLYNLFAIVSPAVEYKIIYSFFNYIFQAPNKKFKAYYSSPSYLSKASAQTSSGNPISINFLTLALISTS